MITVESIYEDILKSKYALDKIAITILVEQLGSMSKVLDKLAVLKDNEIESAYEAEFKSELSDLIFHTIKMCQRRKYDEYALYVYGKNRWTDRHLKEIQEGFNIV